MKFRFLDILLFALLFIFVGSFPVDLLNISSFYRLLIQIGLRFLLVLYYIYILWSYRINIFKFANYRNGLLFLPFVLVCFSNLIAAGISGANFASGSSIKFLILVIIYHLLGVICEEFLFRLFIQNSLVNASSLKRIFASAGIFALFHLLNLVNVSNVNALIGVLIQVGYSFFLGLILALIFEYTYSLPLCIGFHFIFNFFNLIFVENIYSIILSDAAKYLTAIVIGVVAVIYGVILYIFVLTRNERYFHE